MAKANEEELTFLKTFVRWWEEAGIVFYGKGTRDEDEGLMMLVEQAEVILENRNNGERHSRRRRRLDDVS